jgi:hypothetical protein
VKKQGGVQANIVLTAMHYSLPRVSWLPSVGCIWGDADALNMGLGGECGGCRKYGFGMWDC